MGSRKLKNAPLQEVVFELKWELPLDENGIPYDPGFDNALGLFAKEIEHRFPIQKSLLPPNSNRNTAYQLTHQFWQQELVWPVVQLGRGILTVNDVEGNYVWDENYRPIIELAVESLVRSYKNKLQLSAFSLQYVDAVDVAAGVTNSSEFIANNFRTQVINDYTVPGQPNGISIVQLFKLQDDSQMAIQIQTALNETTDKNAIVWVTSVRKEGKLSTTEIIDWLDKAHGHCSSVFKEMLAPDFYASFSQ